MASRKGIAVARPKPLDARERFALNTPRPARPNRYVSDVVMSAPDPKVRYARFYRTTVSGAPKLASPRVAQRVEHSSSDGDVSPLAMQAVAASKMLLQEKTHPVSFAAPKKKSRLPKRLQKLRKSRKALANTLVVFAVMMSGVLGLMAYKYHVAIQKVEAHPLEQGAEVVPAEQDDAVAPNTSNVSEKPVATGSYKVATDVPYKISIPKLKVSATITGVGITKNGAMNVPGNIWQVGWYKTSAKPADNTGVVVLNGHVHGPTQPGIFANLKNLKAGDTVTVTEGSGKTYNYKVVSSQTFKAGEANDSLMQSASPTKQGLNLVTCTGTIRDSEYQDRLVVFTERI